jgi:ribosomal protein L29
VVFEKPQLKLDLVNGINKKNSEIGRLTSKVNELEEELLKFKDENEKLRSQCQAQQSKGNIEQVSEADENIEMKAVSMICGKFLILICCNVSQGCMNLPCLAGGWRSLLKK